MTDLIRHQLASGAYMFTCGIASGLIYQVFHRVRILWVRLKIVDFIVETISLILIGYCITAFLYYSSWGKIAPQDVVCFFGGLYLWRKVYGEEGNKTSRIRKEPSSSEYKRRAGANLHIEKLDLEEKVLVVSGQLESLTYIGKKTKNKKSLVERLVRR